MLYVFDTNAAAQTATEIVAAPGAGKIIEVLGLVVSSLLDDTWSLHDEDDVGHMYLQVLAKTTKDIGPGSVPLFTVAANKALEYTTTGAGTQAVSLIYQIRDA